MASRGLEISGFGTFSGVTSNDIINFVRIKINAFASSALMDPPIYQLWNGNTAQIGTSQTGVESTDSAHLDQLIFTGVSYSQLSSLRLRVYAQPGTAPEGSTQYVDFVSMTINFTTGVVSPDVHIFATAIRATTIIPIPVITAVVASVSLPARGVFYYPWFSGGSYPAYPGAWDQGGIRPWTQYHPARGYYNSTDLAVIDSHINSMVYGKFAFGISSWWGQGSKEDTNLGYLLARAAALGSGFKWCVYYEAEGNAIAGVPGSPSPAAAQITADLNYLSTTVSHHPNYLHIAGKPVIFVYGGPEDDNTVTTSITARPAARWHAGNAAATENWYYVLKVYNGYVTDQPSYPAPGWHQYGPGTNVQTHAAWHYTISPGFWLATEVTPRLVRDASRFATDVQNMLAASVDFKLVTSYNEWGEGHSVEVADGASGRNYVGPGWPSASGYGAYIDILHNDGLSSFGVNILATVVPGTTTIPKPIITANNVIFARVIDCGNLVTEATFERDVILGTQPGWSAQGNPPPTISVSTEQAHQGTHSLKVVATGDQMWFPVAEYQLVTQVGTIYDLSAWVYVPAGSPTTQLIGPGIWGDSQSSTTDTWEKITLSGFPGSGAWDWLGLLLGSAPATFYVDDVRLAQRVIPRPLITVQAGPNSGGSASGLSNGVGTWVNPSYATGSNDDQYATWTVP